jgi:uracil-DNA glycosylase family 4
VSDNPAAELLNLVEQLEGWLQYQGRLGLAGVPRARSARPRPRAKEEGPVISLDQVREELGDCRRCKLSRTRTHIVFGTGDPRARLIFIGEGPGEEEDRQGLPFVGAAGQLLNSLLAKLGVSRGEVYIANVVKCRPPGNRYPESDETTQCLPFLLKQIQAIRPRVIVTLGRAATQAVLDTQTPLTRLRGKFQRWGQIPVMPTFHPSYLLRFPRERHKTWEDMQRVMERLAQSD